jgi:Tol biopolymer transport system component
MQNSPWDVWVTGIDGGQPLNRTSDHPGSDFSPSWSPDGKQIAFRSSRDGGGIFVTSPFSGAPRKIVDASNLRAAPQWSPDGTEILYVVLGEEPDTAQLLEIFSPQTGDLRRMSLPGRWLCRCEIALSPDGRFLAYIDAQGSASQISQLWLLRLEDGEAFRLTDGKTSDWSPSWSDERTLFFVSNRGGIMDLWQQRVRDDGTPDGLPRAVTVGVGMQHAAFSPDGKKLAYSRGRRMSNLYRVPILEDRRATWADAEQLTFDEARSSS